MHSRFGAAVLCAIVAFLPLGAIAQADPLSLRILQVRIDGSRTIDATGFGTVAVRAQLLDGDGKPFLRGSGVRALILRGDARLPAGLSSDLVTDEKSTVTLAISPGTQAGPLVVRFSVGDAAQDVEFTLTANVQAPLVVGYATGGIGPVPGWVEAPDGAPAGNTARRGAVSVFGTGAIANNTRGTFAYDSTDTLQQTLGADPFIDNPTIARFRSMATARYGTTTRSRRTIFSRTCNPDARARCGDNSTRKPHRVRPSAATTYSSTARKRASAGTCSAPARSPRATTSRMRGR